MILVGIVSGSQIVLRIGGLPKARLEEKMSFKFIYNPSLNTNTFYTNTTEIKKVQLCTSKSNKKLQSRVP